MIYEKKNHCYADGVYFPVCLFLPKKDILPKQNSVSVPKSHANIESNKNGGGPYVLNRLYSFPAMKKYLL
ncbi:MAG: hypothetical protein ACXWWC_16115 [Chitinophagaceae bacterium]